MKEASRPGNPASNDYSDIVIYDQAFSEKETLAHVLGHELAHGVFEDLSEGEKTSFRKAAQWKEDPQRKGTFLPTRPAKGFVRSNDMLSPVEDFADSLVTYIHQPERLKRLSPAVYDWIKRHIGFRLKTGSTK